MYSKQLFLVSTIAFILVGCSSTEDKAVVADEKYEHAKPSQASQRISHIIEFDHDSTEIKDGYTTDLKAHAQYIQNSGNRVIIQGAADTVGPGEYNYELGMKRAEAVKAKLVALGVSADLIRVTSIGAIGSLINARRVILAY